MIGALGAGKGVGMRLQTSAAEMYAAEEFADRRPFLRILLWAISVAVCTLILIAMLAFF